MVAVRREPRSIRVVADGHRQPAVALELTGQRAALMSERPLRRDADVLVVLEWNDGEPTELPAVVRQVDSRGRDHVAHVELTGVRGAWQPFLALLGVLSA